MEAMVSWRILGDKGNGFSLTFSSPLFSFLCYGFLSLGFYYWFFCCCRFRVSCMEAMVSWRSLCDKGSGFSLTSSSFLLLVLFFLYRFFNVYYFFLVAGLRFHAWRLGFHGETSMRKVMASLFPSPPSFLFYFIFLLWTYWCLLLFCDCRFNGERGRRKMILGVCLMCRSGSWMWPKEGPCIPVRRSRFKSWYPSIYDYLLLP